AVRNETAVSRHTVHDRAHTELAHTVVHVVTARIARFNAFGFFHRSKVGTGAGSRTAADFWQPLNKCSDTILRSFTARNFFAFGLGLSDKSLRFRSEVSRQVTFSYAALKFSRQFWMCSFISGKFFAPGFFRRSAFGFGIPTFVYIGWNHEWLVIPIQGLTH